MRGEVLFLFLVLKSALCYFIKTEKTLFEVAVWLAVAAKTNIGNEEVTIIEEIAISNQVDNLHGAVILWPLFFKTGPSGVF